MPRIARKMSPTGIYHIILRGINRQTVFSDEEDIKKFLEVLKDCKEISGFKVFGYCFMDNHIHLLIKESAESTGLIFKRIGARYVYWYNWKYQRCGHLFQDRYKSEPVGTNEYFLTVLRYIHQNPIKAGISKKIDGYKWSSYNDYFRQRGITDISFAFSLMDQQTFFVFMSQQNSDKVLEIEDEKIRLTDSKLTAKIINKFKVHPKIIQKNSKEERDKILKEILSLDGVSTRQLSRVTDIPINTIWRIPK